MSIDNNDHYADTWVAAYNEGREAVVEEMHDWLLNYEDEVNVEDIRDFLEDAVSWRGDDPTDLEELLDAVN